MCVLIIINSTTFCSLRRYGSAPLHLAAQKGDLVLVQMLVEYGADPTQKSLDGKTPQEWTHGGIYATESLREATRKWLVEAVEIIELAARVAVHQGEPLPSIQYMCIMRPVATFSLWLLVFPFALLITPLTYAHAHSYPLSPPHTLFTVSSSSFPAAAVRCHHYLKSGWLDSRCKNCCRSKDRCGAWLRKNQPDALYQICASSSAPDMGKVGKLAEAGIDMQYTVRREIGRREVEAPCRR